MFSCSAAVFAFLAAPLPTAWPIRAGRVCFFFFNCLKKKKQPGTGQPQDRKKKKKKKTARDRTTLRPKKKKKSPYREPVSLIFSYCDSLGDCAALRLALQAILSLRRKPLFFFFRPLPAAIWTSALLAA